MNGLFRLAVAMANARTEFPVPVCGEDDPTDRAVQDAAVIAETFRIALRQIRLREIRLHHMGLREPSAAARLAQLRDRLEAIQQLFDHAEHAVIDAQEMCDVYGDR